MIWFILFIPFSVLLYLLAQPSWQALRRAKLRRQPFPKEWRQIMRKNVPFFRNMPADLQLQLKAHMQVFLAEKQFFGQDGLQMNDEIKVTIAAQACLLLLNRKTQYFQQLHSIYVLPTAFVATNPQADHHGIWHERTRVLLGESWQTGKVILSWQHTQEGANDASDGHNLIIHEFAHQLDQETGSANGAPYMASKRQYRDWFAVMSREFKAHQRAVQQRQATLIDYYGATNEAEFFAVSSEVFFEQPQQMCEQHHDLYQQLKHFYKVDPIHWQ